MATAAVCLRGIAAFVGPVLAETLSYLGVTTGVTKGTNFPSNTEDSMNSSGLEGLFAYGFGNGTTLVFEGEYNDNKGQDSNVFGTDPGADYEVAIHALYEVRPGLTLGGFVSTGLAESDRDRDNERYPFNALGVTGSYSINDKFSTYAQYAVVDQPDFDDLSSGGYNEGYAARLGMNYTLNAGNAFYFDAQYGEAVGYEDSREDGVFERYAIGGETRIGGGAWAVNYEVATESYDAKFDSNIVEVTTVTLGARYYFGGTTGADLRNNGVIGTPDIMSRASLFTNGLD